MFNRTKAYQSSDIECPFCGKNVYIIISPPPPHFLNDVYEANCFCGFSTYNRFFESEEELRQYCLKPMKRYLGLIGKDEEKERRINFSERIKLVNNARRKTISEFSERLVKEAEPHPTKNDLYIVGLDKIEKISKEIIRDLDKMGVIE